ncbi:MAG: radical SAM family heme chaperone HemW [Thermodesulfobacteriota bacterium]
MPVGIYIHLPYCVTKCPYCDFNSYGTEGTFPEKEYTNALLKEIELYGDFLKNSKIDTIFFGGGTPSLFSSNSIENIISKISLYSTVSEDVEISLELNPKTADEHKLSELKRIGVNRLSVGVQSFIERKLDFYGRINKPADSENVLNWIKDLGFANFNIDLIYGSSDETLSELKYDLKKALEFGSSHISAYCLTIEDGTEFGRLFKAGRLKIPSDKKLNQFMDYTSTFLEANGYKNYEISNFSKPDFECRHNLIYWRSKDYLGFGAGAHSHINSNDEYPWGVRWFNYRSPSQYISLNEIYKSVVCRRSILSKLESLEDKILMGMRLKEGVLLEDLQNRYDFDFDKNKIGYLIKDEFIMEDEHRLILTKKGRTFTNEIIVRLLDAFV